jgi:hypothetical protein
MDNRLESLLPYSLGSAGGTAAQHLLYTSLICADLDHVSWPGH